MKYLVLLGRIFYSLIFILAAPGHFRVDHVAYAAQSGVPMPNVLVPLSGAIAFFGALSVLFGFKARWGAALLVIFLVPVTLTMHRFWGLTDPQMAMMQQINFMKNLSMLGGAILIIHFGSGPASLKE
jgi:putative oxidoreductase